MTDSRHDAVEGTPPRQARTRLGRWLRTKPIWVDSLFSAGMVFILAILAFTLLDVMWPTEGTSWVDDLVLATALACGMGVGQAVAEWRYGRDSLTEDSPAGWRAFALYLVIMGALIIGISRLAELLFA